MGEAHPSTAQAYFNLGTLLASSANYQEAKVALLKARSILEKSLGPQNIYLATVFDALSMVHEKLGQSKEAKEYAARAYKIRKPEHMRKPQNN
jgi:tetratricopeptide (TPR) repeat protein